MPDTTNTTDDEMHCGLTASPENAKKLALLGRVISAGKPYVKEIRGEQRVIVDWLAICELIQTEKAKFAQSLLEQAEPNPTTPAGEPEFVPVSVIEAAIKEMKS